MSFRSALIGVVNGGTHPTPQEVGKKWEVQRPKLYMGCYLMFRFRFDHQFFLPVCIVIHWRKSKHILEMHELLCLFHFISLCFVSCLFSCSLRFTSSWRANLMANQWASTWSVPLATWFCLWRASLHVCGRVGTHQVKRLYAVPHSRSCSQEPWLWNRADFVFIFHCFECSGLRLFVLIVHACCSGAHGLVLPTIGGDAIFWVFEVTWLEQQVLTTFAISLNMFVLVLMKDLQWRIATRLTCGRIAWFHYHYHNEVIVRYHCNFQVMQYSKYFFMIYHVFKSYKLQGFQCITVLQ